MRCVDMRSSNGLSAPFQTEGSKDRGHTRYGSVLSKVRLSEGARMISKGMRPSQMVFWIEPRETRFSILKCNQSLDEVSVRLSVL